jgi:2'-5' RNA ligase
MNESIRAFVAIELEAGLVQEVVRIQERLQRSLPAGGIRWLRPDQLHLTLRFLGQTDSNRLGELEERLRTSCATTPSMRLKLRGAGCFPSVLRPRVLWVGIEGETERLLLVQRQVMIATEGFGDHIEERAFQPHLTIGRAPADQSRRLAGLREALGKAQTSLAVEWAVSKIHLFQSTLRPEGALYKDLAAIPLAA